MAGLQDTDNGSETRRYGDTVGIPHSESDGTLLENATVQPGDVVTIDTNGELALADANGDGDAIGVLVNYTVYGASHQGEKINANHDATVAVQGTYRAKADDGITASDKFVGTPDSGGSGTPGQFATGSEYRIVDSYDDGSQNWVEVVL